MTATDSVSPAEHSPERLYPTLFDVVQRTGLFSDSKTFADAVPKTAPEELEQQFCAENRQPGFDLSVFVSQHFELPPPDQDLLTTPNPAAPHIPLREYIEQQWIKLRRNASQQPAFSSLIALPEAFIVPGGRFREIYYWDSYFTCLGLGVSGHIDLVESMVANFAYLIERVGFVPNGNRSYYCTRSQPPVFALMVELLAKAKLDKGVLSQYLEPLEQEYRFWMQGSELLTRQGDCHKRVVRAHNGFLNRYWDNCNSPRPESYREDLSLAENVTRPKQALYREIRAACESGWDFSSRWLSHKDQLGSLNTTQVVPIDLNCLLYKLEQLLSRIHAQKQHRKVAKRFSKAAKQRKQLIQQLCFNPRKGFFVDLLLPTLRPSSTLTLAGAFPLWCLLATPKQAAAVARQLRARFLKPGGWVTSLNHTDQQWDAPNGWPPLQWVVYQGLTNYHFNEDAVLGAQRWLDNCAQTYQQTGWLLEKYNVLEPGKLAEGGEYQVQEGFGWTNGVIERMNAALGSRTPL